MSFDFCLAVFVPSITQNFCFVFLAPILCGNYCLLSYISNSWCKSTRIRSQFITIKYELLVTCTSQCFEGSFWTQNLKRAEQTVHSWGSKMSQKLIVFLLGFIQEEGSVKHSLNMQLQTGCTIKRNKSRHDTGPWPPRSV